MLYDWCGMEGDMLPNIIVVVSESMRRNYVKYGDILSFDITYKLLKNFNSNGQQYNVGVFCVFDTNNRILIAGVAILCNESTDSMEKVFGMFIKLHNRPPQTIITDQQMTFAKAIQRLKDKKFYNGIHILDPFHVIRSIRKRLQKEDPKT